MSHNLVLECQTRGFPVSRIKLEPGKCVLGRSRKCGIYVPDPTVSRFHAEVLVSALELDVVDLGSRNGTFVEETPVESSPVRLGQFLRFGAVRFRLTSHGDQDRSVESEVETCEAPPDPPVSLTNATIASLSPAQRRVFDFLRNGLAEKEVAARLKISQHTVHNHTREIYRIFGVHSRPELLSCLLPHS